MPFLPPLHCVRFPSWIIATLFSPAASVFTYILGGTGGRGASAKCRDNPQHGSWWETERHNGVTNLHCCESFRLLTWVAGKITSLPCKTPPKKHSTLYDPWKCPKVACWDFISSRGTRGICFLILWFTHLIEMSEGKGSIVLGWHQEVSWYGWEWLGGTSRRGGYSVRK